MREITSILPLRVFSSPMMASTERLLSRLAFRVAGPQSFFASRNFGFIERIFSRSYEGLGLPSAKALSLSASHYQGGLDGLVLPRSWIPSAEVLRGERANRAFGGDFSAGRRPAALPRIAPALPGARPAARGPAWEWISPAPSGADDANLRVRDWLATQPLAAPIAPETTGPADTSALSRTLWHLGWADARTADAAPGSEYTTLGAVPTAERKNRFAAAMPMLSLAFAAEVAARQPAAAFTQLGSLGAQIADIARTRQAPTLFQSAASANAAPLIALAAAPGVSSALARILLQQTSAPSVRFAQPLALPYLASPQSVAAVPAPASASPRPASLRPAVPTSIALPWREAGGAALLAELFVAGVGLGSGALGTLMQSSPASRSEGLISNWLQPLLRPASRWSNAAEPSPEAPGRAFGNAGLAAPSMVFVPGPLGVGFAQAGGVGLRAELQAIAQGTRVVGAEKPLPSVQRSWASAPGVSLSLASLLTQDAGPLAPRWQSPEVLPYLPYSAKAEAPTKQPASVQKSAAPVPALQKPWLATGGTAALAELFAADVNLSSGRAGLLGEGTTALKKSPLADWLHPLLNPEIAPSAQLVPRTELRPAPWAYVGWEAISDFATAKSALAEDGGVKPRAKTSEAMGRSAKPQEPAGHFSRAGGLSAQAERFAAVHGLSNIDRQAAAGHFVLAADGLVFVAAEQTAQAAEKAVREPPLAHSAWAATGGIGLAAEIFGAPSRIAALSFESTARTSSLPSPFGVATGSLFYLGPSSALQPGPAPFDVKPASSWSALSHLPAVQPMAPSSLGRGQTAVRTGLAEDSVRTAVPAAAVLAERSGGLGRNGDFPMLALAGLYPAAGEKAAALQAEKVRRAEVFAKGGLEVWNAGTARQGIASQALLENANRVERLLSHLPDPGPLLPGGAPGLSPSSAGTMPLWQRLPAFDSQTLVSSSLSASPSPASAEARPVRTSRLPGGALTMIQGERAKAPPPPPAASAQQSPAVQLMSSALSASGASREQIDASARLLQAIQSHAVSAGKQTDTRLDLSDLALIAISMGENKMAASPSAFSSTSTSAVTSGPSAAGPSNSMGAGNHEAQLSELVEKVYQKVCSLLRNIEIREAGQNDQKLSPVC